MTPIQVFSAIALVAILATFGILLATAEPRQQDAAVPGVEKAP